MNIAFYTEGNWTGKVERTHPNMRTDLAWYAALGAIHYPLMHGARVPDNNAELGIIIVPKKQPELAFAGYELVRNECRTVAVMQEGPNWYWQDWSIERQLAYIQLLQKVDIIFVHNTSDVSYFEGLVKHSDVRVMPTLMIEDAIAKKHICVPHCREGVMLGGNFVSWYGGFDSYLVATDFDEEIYAPSMGRKQSDEDNLDVINYLPYLTWRDWITELSHRKYAVHLMRTHAAGTFALNCAYLGIPCIGYKGLDTQELCHPKLTVEVGDLVGARKLVNHLKTNEQFYKHCSVVAKHNYQEHFGEKHFIDRVINIY